MNECLHFYCPSTEVVSELCPFVHPVLGPQFKMSIESSPSSSAAAVRPRPHLQCLHPGCGRRFGKASRLAEHGRMHRRERAAAAPDERLPTPGQKTPLLPRFYRISISFHLTQILKCWPLGSWRRTSSDVLRFVRKRRRMQV